MFRCALDSTSRFQLLQAYALPRCLTENLTDGYAPHSLCDSPAQARSAFTEIDPSAPFRAGSGGPRGDEARGENHHTCYCARQHLAFTRSRPNKKNNQSHVEERNGLVVRRLVGYDRCEGERATRAFNALYDCLRLWVNLGLPSLGTARAASMRLMLPTFYIR